MVTGSNGPRAVVIGPPGAGKSTVGRRLGEGHGADVHDTGEAIERAPGGSLSDIFVVEGERYFRDLERAEVARALGECAGVVAVGGGAPMDPDTQASLGGHAVVFLDVGIADASRRIGFDGSRPLLLVNPRAQWTKMMNERRPTYERLASLRVDTAGRQPDAVVAEIVAWLEEQG